MIEEMLTNKPFHFGESIDEREKWDGLLDSKTKRKLIDHAKSLIKKPLPEFSDDVYLEFTKTGSRKGWQDQVYTARKNLKWIVLAECIEDKGRFLPYYEKYVNTVCGLKTWVLPAHDKKLNNFHGEQIDIDLISSSIAANLASSLRLLEPRLSTKTKQLIKRNVEKRVLKPFKDMILDKRKKNWWLLTTNNWNAVCLAGVTVASQAILDSKEKRAFYLLAARDYSKNYLKGFTKDGYCSEGLGYWNYGFGNYILMAETMRQASGNKLDLTDRKSVLAPAMFPQNIEMINQISPAFADCGVDSKANKYLVNYVNHRFKLAPVENYSIAEELFKKHIHSDLLFTLIHLFPNSLKNIKSVDSAKQSYSLRTWFNNAGILICRPKPDSPEFAVALKGGNNKEHHNHNDIGSYVLVCDKTAVLVDPGTEVYTARTFSSRRYESDVLNSYGHPVPVINGELQHCGKYTSVDTSAKILLTEFTEKEDIFSMEIKSAYNVKSLKSLVRTFIYSREEPKFIIKDKVVFSSPGTYENAFITFGKYKKIDEKSFLVSCEGESVRITIDSPDVDFVIKSEKLKADTRTKTKPTRIGVKLKRAVISTEMSYTIKRN